MNVNIMILLIFINVALCKKGAIHGEIKTQNIHKSGSEVHPYIRFDKNYNTKKMPLKHLPLDVNLTINIKNIYGIDEVKQLLGMETTVQMNWVDDRVVLLDIAKEHVNLDRITLPPDVSLKRILQYRGS